LLLLFARLLRRWGLSTSGRGGACTIKAADVVIATTRLSIGNLLAEHPKAFNSALPKVFLIARAVEDWDLSAYHVHHS
jgi:hypothetical protein